MGVKSGCDPIFLPVLKFTETDFLEGITVLVLFRASPAATATGLFYFVRLSELLRVAMDYLMVGGGIELCHASIAVTEP